MAAIWRGIGNRYGPYPRAWASWCARGRRPASHYRPLCVVGASQAARHSATGRVGHLGNSPSWRYASNNGYQIAPAQPRGHHGRVPATVGYPARVERLTTTEAARRLGVSVATVRRRCAAGLLRSETEARPQGARLWVLWDGAPDAPPTEQDAPPTRRAASAEASPTAQDAPGAASAPVPRADYDWLRQRLEASEQAQAELRRLLLAAHQTIDSLRLALPPPHGAATHQDAPAEASGTVQGGAWAKDTSAGPQAPPRPAGRPWWRFWQPRAPR